MNIAETILNRACRVLERYPTPNLARRESFLQNLTFLYHTMKASEQLLTLALERSVKDDLLVDYYAKHLEEERDHVEWLKADLAEAGIAVEKTPAPQCAVLICGSVYYHLYHTDPAALLGYMLWTEGKGLPPGTLEYLEALYGKKLLRTVRYHVVNDVDHTRDLKEVINKLPSSRQEVVLNTALETVNLFGLGMSEIVSKEVNYG